MPLIISKEAVTSSKQLFHQIWLIQMELNNVFRLSALNAASLNAEEVCGLQVAMQQRKLEENLTGKLYFWGKIFGSKQDYLIVFLLDTSGEFPTRKYYFWYLIALF